jgi:amino acid permease
MKKATLFSIIITTVCYLLCGCMGYAAFGNYAPGNLLTGFGFYNPCWTLPMLQSSFTLLVPIKFDISSSNDLTSHASMTRFKFHVDLSMVHLHCRSSAHRDVYFSEEDWAMDEPVAG